MIKHILITIYDIYYKNATWNNLGLILTLTLLSTGLLDQIKLYCTCGCYTFSTHLWCCGKNVGYIMHSYSLNTTSLFEIALDCQSDVKLWTCVDSKCMCMFEVDISLELCDCYTIHNQSRKAKSVFAEVQATTCYSAKSFYKNWLQPHYLF